MDYKHAYEASQDQLLAARQRVADTRLELAQTKELLEKALTTLDFYADHNNYLLLPWTEDRTTIAEDGGAQARDVLKTCR